VVSPSSLEASGTIAAADLLAVQPDAGRQRGTLVHEFFSKVAFLNQPEALPDDASRRAFEDAVLEGCRSDYPVRSNGRVLYPFRRVFFIAYAR
jgi:hypothetical protein